MPHCASLLRDFRDVVRGLRRSPWFTLTVVATLAAGLGISAAAFTVTNAALFSGFPLVEHNDRIVYLTTTNDTVYYPDFADWRTTAASFSDVGLVRNVYTTLDLDGDLDAHFTTEVSANVFSLLGVRPLLGRDFRPDDERPGAQPVAILRYDLWKRRFGADPGVIGRSIRMNGVATIVIGVMPQGFSFPTDQDLWKPLIPTPAALRRETPYARYAVARLADGVTAAAALAEMQTIAARLAQTYPLTNRGIAPVVQSFAQWSAGPKAAALYEAAFGAVVFVLLIVCANAASLMLDRALGKSRDAAIRLAMGASRAHMIRRLFLESLTLSLLGGLGGWLVAEIALHAYALAQPSLDYTRILSYAVTFKALLFLATASVAAGVAIGAVAATGGARADPGALRDSRGGVSLGNARATRGLVALQLALAVVLLAGAGVLLRSFANVVTADTGADDDSVLSMSLYLPPERYADDEARVTFYRRLQERLASIPGVESVGFGTAAPGDYVPNAQYEIEDAPIDGPLRPTVTRFVADRHYFAALRVSVTAGRAFDESDGAAGVPVAIVNARFARSHWPSTNPLGKRLRFFAHGTVGPWLTVVGLATNVVQNDPSRQTFEPMVYVPFSQAHPPNMFAFARTRVPPGSLVQPFRRAVYALDPSLPVPALSALRERLQRSLGFERRTTATLVVFAAASLLLACVGLYASVSRAVSKRTQEIGLRAALGATSRDIRGLVLATAAVPAALGLAVGLVASAAVNRLLAAELVRVSPSDPLTLTLVAVALVAATGLGCAIPARRAARVDPVVALRHE